MKAKLPIICIRGDTLNRQSLYIDRTRLTREEIDMLRKDGSYIKLWIIKHVIVNLKPTDTPEVIRQIEFYDLFIENMK